MNILCTGIHQAFQYIAHGFSGTVIDICFQLINHISRKTAFWFRGTAYIQPDYNYRNPPAAHGTLHPASQHSGFPDRIRYFNQHGTQNAWAFISAFSGTNADTGNLKLFRELLDQACMTDTAKKTARRIFEILGRAEAKAPEPGGWHLNPAVRQQSCLR